ncbi:leucine-rich repeat domain-containing protein [Aquimarina sp. 2304DJ70-9]|uniref:leucine-rich repeat domain-containing protein n=1 Tax=Aquimarina penaris TaxID=3231044 RepID=UPI003462554D
MKKQLFILGALVLGFVTSSCNSDDDVGNGNLSQQQESLKILSFEFLASNNDNLQEDVIATIDEANKTITAVLPASTSLTFLEPTIKVSEGARIFPGEGFPENFTQPVEYKVTGDGFSESTYTVTAILEDNNESKIIRFDFDVDRNPSANLNEDVFGIIEDNTITIEFPSEANISALIPTIELSSGATINPGTDITQDFTNGLTYTVTAQDGVTKTEYSVETYKDAISKVTFTINGEEYNATINGQDVSLELPTGTDLDNLTPIIETSNGITVSPVSGQAQNFNELLIYTITRNDGTTQEYRFDIYIEDSPRSDRAVLVEFYKANFKLDNLNLPVEYLRNWDLNATEIDNWSGVTLNSSGRVVSFSIAAAALVTVYELPESIGKLSMLESLSIISSKLSELPDGINTLSNLSFLILIDNRLTSLPSTLDGLNQLTLLDLGQNNIQTIQVGVYRQLINLVSLRLNDNNISEIPRALGDLRTSNLGTLDLRGNPVTNIPKEVCELFDNPDNLRLDEDDICEE